MSLPSVPIGSQTSLICSIISHPLRVHDGGDRRMLVNGPHPSKLTQISKLSGWKLCDQSRVFAHSKSCHSTLTPSLPRLPNNGRHSPSTAPQTRFSQNSSLCNTLKQILRTNLNNKRKVGNELFVHDSHLRLAGFFHGGIFERWKPRLGRSATGLGMRN
jgi:hypothetical protein